MRLDSCSAPYGKQSHHQPSLQVPFWFMPSLKASWAKWAPLDYDSSHLQEVLSVLLSIFFSLLIWTLPSPS